MKDLEEAEAIHRAAAKAFAEVVETSAEHVVEVNREEASAFREQVLALAGLVSGSTVASELDAARGAFRGELREYSRKAGQRVHRMREELAAAAEAMRVVAESVTTSSGEHEAVLRREFLRLQDTAESSEDVYEVRASIHATVDTVTNSFEALKRSNAMNLAQLRDEIRVLQEELQKERKKDTPAGLVSKESLDKEIEALLRLDRPFAAAVIGVPTWRTLYARYPHPRVDAALGTMLANLIALSRKRGGQPAIAPLQNGVYALILPPGSAVGDWQAQLSLSHSFQTDGLPQTFRITPRVEIVERASGEPHMKFFDRLSRAAGAVLVEEA